MSEFFWFMAGAFFGSTVGLLTAALLSMAREEHAEDAERSRE